MAGFANAPFAFQPDTPLRGKKRTVSTRFNSPARIDKAAWFYCLKCQQQGHLMPECEKVRAELQQALAEQLAQQLNGAPLQEDAIITIEAEASENHCEKDDENIVEPVKRVKVQDEAIQHAPDGDVLGNALDATKPSGAINSFSFHMDVQRAREPMVTLDKENTVQDTLPDGYEPMESISMSINLLNI
ncbi:hypothetical protein AAVH_01032 [Aphelenchoides avenae]|nr:hypothetical protein AAVH_01032 [Aphelenchus avenae]